MAEKKVRLRVVTPVMTKFDEKVDMVIMKCAGGDWGILPNHEPYSAVVADGIVRIFNNKEEKKIAVFGGYAEVLDNVITLLTTDAEWPEDVDRVRAENDRDRAMQRLLEKQSDTEIQSDQVLLRRSLVRIEVSSYSIINKSKWEE